MRVVRKVDADGDYAAFWINADDEMRGWYGNGGPTDPATDVAIAGGLCGWRATEERVARCGTTLSALHQELTEGGEGQ